MTQGTITKRGISAVSMLDKRIINNGFIDVYDQAGLADVMGLLPKGYEAVTQPMFSDFYNSDLFVALDTTGATFTTNGTASVTISAITTATSGYVRKNLKLQTPSGKTVQVQSYSTTSGQDVNIVVKSVDGTNITLTAGQKLTPLNMLVGEGSKQVESLQSTPTRIFNLIEHSRENMKMTDVQIQSDVEVAFEGSNYIWNQQIAETFLRFKAGINANLIGGQISVAKFEDAVVALPDPTGGGAEQTSRGLDQYVTTWGVLDSVDTLGTPDLDDFEDFGALITAARGPRKYVGYGSNAVVTKFSKLLKGLAGSIAGGQLMLDGKTLDLTAERLIHGKYDLQVVALPIFDNGILLSQSDIVKSLYWVPEGQASTQDGKRKPYMSIKYMKQVVSGNIGNDIWSEWDTGALARGGHTDGDMIRSTHWHTAQALHIIAPQHFGRQKFLS